MTVQLCVTYPFGTLVRLTASFTRPPTDTEITDGTAADADDWQPVDPDTVTAKTLDPDGVVEQYDYLGSPVGGVVRTDVGEYYVALTPAIAGTWTFRFESTGNGAAANEHTFKVAQTAFAII